MIIIISIKEKQLLLPRPSWLGKESISLRVDPTKSQLWSETWAADLNGKEDKQVPSGDRTFILVTASWGVYEETR